MILLFVSSLSSSAFSQEDMYYSRQGNLTIVGAINGEPLRLETNALNVSIDYESAVIFIRFNVNTLQSGRDSVQLLIDDSDAEVIFDGKLGIEHVNTDSHPPLSFATRGWLTIGDIKSQVTGTGELYHIGSSIEDTCLLSMTMALSLSDLNLQLPLNGLNDSFEAVMTQTLLRRDKN